MENPLKKYKIIKGRLSNPTKKEYCIDLFNELDFTNGTTSIDTQNGSLIFKANMSDLLNRRLIQGEKEGKLINIKNFRSIGKTTALINFAKERNYIVIVSDNTNARELRRDYGYDDIYSWTDNRLDFMRDKACVVDEGVDTYYLRSNIITGYTNK